MRPLVWWVQDHLGLAAIGVLGVAAVAVAVILGTAGGSSEAPQRSTEVVAGPPTTSGHPAQNGNRRVKAPHQEAPARHQSRDGNAKGAQASRGARASKDRKQSQGDQPENAGGASPGTSSATPSDQSSSNPTKPRQPTPATKLSLGNGTAEQVAAAHPGVECPKSYSSKQCEQAVEAAADPAPATTISQPSDCAKAMSEAQCEELFAAEAAARAAGTGSTSPQECMEHPEQEKCAAVVEEMEAQYEAAHSGG